MKLAIFSDLHMGDGSRRDDFIARSNIFLSELNSISVEYKIISLGDMLDIARFDFKDIINANDRVIQALSERDFIYIIGNHDIDLNSNHYRRKLPSNWIYANQLFINNNLFMHGHLFDPFCSGKFAWIGWKAIKLSNWIGKWLPGLEDKLAVWGGKLVGTGRNSGDKFEQLAINHIRNSGYLLMKEKLFWNGVVTKSMIPELIKIKSIYCGHTHRAKKIEFEKNRFYINAGSWTYGGDPILKVEV